MSGRAEEPACTCLACLEGVRIGLSLGQYDDDKAHEVLDGLAVRTVERAEMLARRFGTEHEIRLRMPAGWEPPKGWFEAHEVKRSNA